MMRSTQPLPADWEERIDPSSGRKFYLNMKTRTTSWTRPANQVDALFPRSNAPSSSWGLSEMPLASVPAGQPVVVTRTPSGAVSPPRSPTNHVPVAETAGPRGKGGFSKGGLFGSLWSKGPKKKKPAEGDGATQSGEQGGEAIHTAQQALEPRPDPVTSLSATMRDGGASTDSRIDAVIKLSARIRDIVKENSNSEMEEALAVSVRDGTLALQIVDTLGSTADASLQAALCRALWLMAESDAVAAAVAEGGGMFYLGALLGSPSDAVATEATLLLISLTRSAAASSQLVTADGIGPLLTLLTSSRDMAVPLRSSALQILANLCRHDCAPAVLSTVGAATALATDLVRSAAVAKGWSGGRNFDGTRWDLDLLMSLDEPLLTSQYSYTTCRLPSVPGRRTDVLDRCLARCLVCPRIAGRHGRGRRRRRSAPRGAAGISTNLASCLARGGR